jgi:hypothetical protein
MASFATDELVSPARCSASRAGLVAASALAALALVGCVVAPLPPAGYPYPMAVEGPPGAVVVAPQAPPPPIVETVVAAPAPGYLWIGGYWSWTGGRHVWTRGYWAAPRPGYRWVPRQWVHGPGGWHQRGGQWAR